MSYDYTMAWEKLIPELDINSANTEGWTNFRCPLHNDNRKSAGFNVESMTFNCFACGDSMNLYDYIQLAYPELKTEEEVKLFAKSLLTDTTTALATGMRYPNDLMFDMMMDSMELNKQTLQQLGVFKLNSRDEKELFTVPVYYNDMLLDVRTYSPDGQIKCRSLRGAKAGLIIGYNQWQAANIQKHVPIWVCAGEKDMLIARTKGLQAITITGGELAIPKMYASQFRDQAVNILYDNDDAGRHGAEKLAQWLYEQGAIVKIVNAFHSVCQQDKEDIYDYFTKYRGTTDQLINWAGETSTYEPEEGEVKDTGISLEEAILPQNNNKFVQTTVRISTGSSRVYRVPSKASFTKKKHTTKDPEQEWPIGVAAHYVMRDKADTLRMMETDKMIESLMKSKAWSEELDAPLPLETVEKGFKMEVEEYINISKCWANTYVGIDYVLDGGEVHGFSEPLELPLFVIDDKLTTNGVYKITYKVVPHPLNKQELVGVVTDSVDITDNINVFKPVGRELASLRAFQVKENGSVEEKINELYARFKGFAGNYIPWNLFITQELVYNSVLSMQYRGKYERGNILLTIIGDSRSGKSETFTQAVKKYGKGKFASAKSATTVGLLGGSSSVGGDWRIKPGLLTREHGRLVVLEEVQGADEQYYKSSTDIKSSGTVRIARSDGDVTFPTQLRLVEIANPKQSRTCESYPNGVEIIKELIDKPEDIARQDLYTVVPQSKNLIDPKDKTGLLEPLSQLSYSTRINWVWSKRMGDIEWEDGAEDKVWDMSGKLNKVFACDVQIFGAETYKKLARISVAVACMVVSTNEDYSKVVVKKEHVAYAVSVLKKLYTDSAFKLHLYANKYRKLTEIDEDSTTYARMILEKAPSLIYKWANTGEALALSNLEMYGTYTKDELKKYLKDLMKLDMVDNIQGKWIPTKRFKLSSQKAIKELESRDINDMFDF